MFVVHLNKVVLMLLVCLDVCCAHRRYCYEIIDIIYILFNENYTWRPRFKKRERGADKECNHQLIILFIGGICNFVLSRLESTFASTKYGIGTSRAS